MEKEEIINIIELAIKIRENAYANYSKFKVGAVAVDENGDYHYGVNIENLSYGLTNCAERSAIFSAISKGIRKINILCVVADSIKPVYPCGACRQVMREFFNQDTTIICANIKNDYEIFKIDDLLPYGFENYEL